MLWGKYVNIYKYTQLHLHALHWNFWVLEG